MNSKPRSFTAFVLLGLCAYGLGMLVGRPLGRVWVGIGQRTQPQISAQTPPQYGKVSDSQRSTETVEEVSALLPKGSNVLTMFDDKLAELDRSISHESRDLLPLLFLLSTNDFPTAWDRIKRLRSPGLQEQLQMAALRNWARKDPHGALAAAMALPDTAGRDHQLQEVLGTWAENDPDGALAWASQMPASERRDETLGRVIAGAAKENPAAAARLLASLPPGETQAMAAVAVIGNLAPTDPDAAMAILSQVRQAGDRETCLSAITQAKAALSIPDTLAWAENLSSSKDRETALNALISSVAKTQPSQGVEWVMAESDPQLRNQMTDALVGTWVQRDAQAAGSWAAQLPEGPVRQQALLSLAQNWSSQAPEAAADFAANSAGAVRTTMLKNVARDWAMIDSGASAQWLLSLPADDARAQAAQTYITTVETTRPDLAAQLVGYLPDDSQRNQQIEIIARNWLSVDPASAQKWLEQAALPADIKASLLGGRPR